MSSRLSLTAIGHATSITLAISFVLCVLFDLRVNVHIRSKLPYLLLTC